MSSPSTSPKVRDLRIGEYLAFARRHPEQFERTDGIRILLDPADIAAVEDQVAADLRRRGLPEAGAEVGILAADPWLYIIRDAVEFPDGGRRGYLRVINRTGHGCAVLCVLDGRIMLTRQFRHALRRWSPEIPRGAIELGQTPDDTAVAEVREEMGGEIESMVPMGFVHGSTNLYYNGAHLYFAKLKSVGAPQLSEAIVAIERPTVAEFERMLTVGEITDSFTVSAFCHARLRGLI